MKIICQEVHIATVCNANADVPPRGNQHQQCLGQLGPGTGDPEATDHKPVPTLQTTCPTEAAELFRASNIVVQVDVERVAQAALLDVDLERLDSLLGLQ